MLYDLEQLGTCAGPIEVKQGIARVVLASMPDKQPRLMLEQADTPEDVSEVERRFTHPLLKKTVRRSKKYHAHDEASVAKLGDRVWIEECPPISKLKRWVVTKQPD